MTIGDLKGALCTPGKDALGTEQYSTLNAVLDAAADVDLGDLPSLGTNPLVLVAPNNDAFAAALKQLGVSAEDLLKDTKTLTKILAEHVGFAESKDAESATDLNSESLMFMVGGEPSSLESTWPVDGKQVEDVSIMGPVNTADVSAVIRCVGGEQTIFGAESVLLPKDLAPAPEPTPGPTPEPTPGPTPEPSSATGTSVAVSAGALVLGALQFL